MIALDTNLLVYAHRARVPEHRRARAAIERASNSGRGCGVAYPSIAEFWAVVTHRSPAGRPSSPKEAAGFLGGLFDGGITVWMPQEGFYERFIQAASDLHAEGMRIFDLQIALVAFDSGANEIWTHDSAFLTVPGLKVHDPIRD